MPFTAPKVKALGVILFSKMGSKFYSKYYTQYSTTDFSKSQFDLKSEAGIKKFQKALNQKLKKVNLNANMGPEKTEIFSFGGMSILFKLVNQLLILLLCEQQENFVLMQNAINCIGNVLPMITTEPYLQKTIQDNLDSIVICVDEVLDQGIILCLDQNKVYDRMKMREGSEKRDISNTASTAKPAQQQTTSAFNSFFGFAKNTLQKTLNLG